MKTVQIVQCPGCGSSHLLANVSKATTERVRGEFVYHGAIGFTCRGCHHQWLAEQTNLIEETQLRDSGFPPLLLDVWKTAA